MADSNKRKPAPGGRSGRPFKKSKGGVGGRWQTPHQKEVREAWLQMGKSLDLGDAGIWVTCAKNQEGRAMREFQHLCDEYGALLYNIKSARDDAEKDADGEGQQSEDIEASIQQELDCIKASKPAMAERPFTTVRPQVACLFFVKTRPPVEPVELVRRICEDAKAVSGPTGWKARYLNRLNPVSLLGKATESGVEKVARQVLQPWFELRSEGEKAEDNANQKPSSGEQSSEKQGPAYSYAIRYNFRNHKTLESGEVIKQIASLIGVGHKVNLTSPDKVILVEVFQAFCGMSVVDGRDWDRLKKFNVAELYKLPLASKAGSKDINLGDESKVGQAGKGDATSCTRHASATSAPRDEESTQKERPVEP